MDSREMPAALAAWKMVPSTSMLTALVHSSSRAYLGLHKWTVRGRVGTRTSGAGKSRHTCAHRVMGQVPLGLGGLWNSVR